jgi:hypothetical protein
MTFADVIYIVLAFIFGVPVLAAFIIMIIETIRHIVKDFIDSLGD